jgi:hypothetical protein
MDDKQHRYLTAAKDHQEYRRRRAFLAKASASEVDNALASEGSPHACIYGRSGGGITVVHHDGEGSEPDSYEFEPHEETDAIEHLHALIAPEFQESEKEK